MRYERPVKGGRQSGRGRRSRKSRCGAILVWCAFLLVALLGMVGLVIDGGLMLAAHRHTQNAADAAALAAAYDMMRGESNAVATATATGVVTGDTDYNNLANANVTINIPPSSGGYAGAATYAEAIVDRPIPTFFIHVLPGVNRGQTVQARAVAGYELVTAGKGVMTLDPEARPGLKISGGATLEVHGDVIVNSEGGGVDENGDPVIVDSSQTSTTVNNNGVLKAETVEVVGGVNATGIDEIENVVEGGPNPLHANQLPTPDPLLYLPTPTTQNGVVNVFQGAPQASDGGLALNAGADSNNFIRNDGTQDQPIPVMVLHPGIYESIKVTGGRVEFKPGIYVLKPAPNTSFALEVIGGQVTADGIMFYNTGDNYDAVSGEPDASDYALDPQSPPPPDGAHFADVKINDGIHMKPLDTTGPYDYGNAPAEMSAFDGMLFYQRRQSDAGIQIEGNSADGELTGTWYAKWGSLSIDGQGTYNGSFIVGELNAEGQGTMTINPDGQTLPEALQVFLVE